MSPTRLALLSLLAMTIHRLDGQGMIARVPETVRKTCDPNYKPNDGGLAGGGGPIPFSVVLCERGIGTSDASLIVALHDPDPSLRTLAAGQLMVNRDPTAMKALLDVLSQPDDTNTKVFIATGLLGMGYSRGARELEVVCSDPTQPVEVVVRATRGLIQVETSLPQIASPVKCADVVLAAFDRADSPNQKIDLLLLLPGLVRHVPQDEALRMVSIEQGALLDEDFRVRIQSGYALYRMGSTASMGLIRDGIKRESSDGVRISLQMDLDSLQKLLASDPTAPELYTGYGSPPIGAAPTFPNTCKSGPGIDLGMQNRMRDAKELVNAGDPAGGRQLEAMCSDISLPTPVVSSVTMAIETSEWQHPGLASASKCVSTVLADYSRAGTCFERIDLISLFPGLLKEASADDASKMMSLTRDMLKDDSAAVRIYAANVLVRIDSSDAVASIRGALQTEIDGYARREFQKDIDLLVKRTKDGEKALTPPLSR